jgi:hypothetical protein
MARIKRDGPKMTLFIVFLFSDVDALWRGLAARLEASPDTLPALLAVAQTHLQALSCTSELSELRRKLRLLAAFLANRQQNTSKNICTENLPVSMILRLYSLRQYA